MCLIGNCSEEVIGTITISEAIGALNALHIHHEAERSICLDVALLVEPFGHFSVEALSFAFRALVVAVKVLTGVFSNPDRLVEFIMPLFHVILELLGRDIVVVHSNSVDLIPDIRTL